MYRYQRGGDANLPATIQMLTVTPARICLLMCTVTSDVRVCVEGTPASNGKWCEKLIFASR